MASDLPRLVPPLLHQRGARREDHRLVDASSEGHDHGDEDDIDGGRHVIAAAAAAASPFGGEATGVPAKDHDGGDDLSDRGGRGDGYPDQGDTRILNDHDHSHHDPPPLPPPPPRLGPAIAGAAGNVLEWYDFAAFGYLSDVLGRVFFPPSGPGAANGGAAAHAYAPSNATARAVSWASAAPSASPAAAGDYGGGAAGHAATIQAFAVFGGAFLMRPLGGLWLGHVGDKFGRRSALVASLFLMAIPTFALGCLPTYAQVGSWAIVLLVVVRLLQGLSVGGQLMGSLVFTLERYPRRHWGWYGSCVMASANAGSLLGSLVGFALRSSLSPDQLESWGWRIPFLSGILVGGAGCYLRWDGGGDDAEGAAAHAHSHGYQPRQPPAANPICVALRRENARSLLAASLVPTLWSGGFYLTFVWMAVYMEELVESPVPRAFGVNTAAMLLSLCVFFPLAGAASDRVGRRAVMTAGGVGSALLGPLALRLIAAASSEQGGGAARAGRALAGQLALGIAVSCWGAPMCAWLVEGFEPRARLTSVSIGYNVAQAVAGGSSPALATYLVDRWGPAAPGWLYAALSCLALTGLWIVAPPPSYDAPSLAPSRRRLRRHKDGDFAEVPGTDDDAASSPWNVEMTPIT